MVARVRCPTGSRSNDRIAGRGGPITETPSLADLLRRHRRAARLTLEQLAEAAAVSARTLSDVERGRSTGPQHRTVTAIAGALALSEEDRRQLIELARDGRLRDRWTRPTGLCELPSSVADFTGRAAELAWIDGLVHAESLPGVPLVGLITGSAGLGKTAFAVRAAHVLRSGFPGGVFFLDLLGMSPRPLAVDDALALLLGALGVSEPQLPADTLGRASLYRARTRDQGILVVLDNVASEEQVRPLLPGGGRAGALVTSRRLLAGLEGVRRLALGPLQPTEATELLSGIVGERSTTDGESALARLAQLSGGLPLALRIIGNRLVSRPGWSTADLAARLSDERRRLDQLKAGDLKIANAFAMSYEQLPGSARRVFRRLGAVPGHDFDAVLAAVAGDTSIEDSWDALDELVDLGLLQDTGSGRYRLHDLVGLFARDRLQREETAPERTAVTDRTTAWLLDMAITAGRWFEPAYGSPQGPDPELLELASLDEADRWLRANADNWLAALRTAAAEGRHTAVLDCAESMHWYSDRWIHAPHWHEVFSLGAAAAAALGDLPQHATQLNYVAWVYMIPLRDPETGLRHARAALEIAERGEVTAQIAWAHQYAGIALRSLGRLGEGAVESRQAAELFSRLGDMDSYTSCVTNVGHCMHGSGRYAEGLLHYGEVLDVLDDAQSGMTPSIAALARPHALGYYGWCLKELGRRAEAIAALTEATELLTAFDANFRQGQFLESLADLLAQDGQGEESRRTYARAADMYERTGDEEAGRRCAALSGGPAPDTP
ncbi:helix-turn-helix domain-containing protein [Streptomyces sp. NPDC048290]|uniref:helix-turn-helix domain-containing protein n=1 Tax=Streptomyces sp. NPDC048290 TaxID=3155811 RepID=UPI003434605D